MLETTEQCVIYYESWVKDDGFPPFSVGDTIHWVLTDMYDLNDPVIIVKIDYLFYFKTYLQCQTYVIEGKISRIQIVYHNYIKNIHTDYFIPIEGVLIDTDRVEGFEKNFNNMHVDAYIVTITDFTIREGFKEDQNNQI